MLSRIGGTASAVGAVAWLVVFGQGTDGGRVPVLESLMWAFPLAFGLGTIALYGGIHRRLDRVAAWAAAVVAVLSALSLLVGSIVTRGVGTAAYVAWLGFVGGIVVLCGLAVAYGVRHRNDRTGGNLARIVLVAAGLPFAFLLLILAYKVATGWWVTDPTLVEIGTIGAAVLVGGAWLVIGIALWTRPSHATSATPVAD